MMTAPRRNSKAYPIWLAAQEAERLRPKSNTNWSHPYTNIITGLNSLRKALASGLNAKLEKRWNEECEFPLRVNPKAPWKEQVSKKFKHKVWVVVLYYNYPKVKIPVAVHILNFLAYPLKFIPEKSTLQMDNYKCIWFRIGSVQNGYQIEFQIPKKFSFDNNKK
jgi:hypothetical protein